MTTKVDVLGYINDLETKNEELKIVLAEAKKEVEEKGRLEEKCRDLIASNKSAEIEFNKLKEEKEKLEEKGKSLFVKYRKPKKTKGDVWDGIIISDVLLQKLRLSVKTKMPMLLKGPSGTGKSTIVRAIAAEDKVEAVDYNFNGDTTVEHLLGHMVLEAGGKMKFQDGPLTDAVRTGKYFLAQEINASNPEVQFILNGLIELDKNGELGKLSVQGNNGEVITPHKNFRFFGTYNPGYLGTKTFSTSLMSRFIGAEVKPLSLENERVLLQAKFPKATLYVNLLTELESNLRKKKDFRYDISTRDITQTLMFIEGGFKVKEAIDATIANSLQLDIEIGILEDEVKNLLSKYEIDE